MAKYKIIPSSRTIVQSPISIGHKAEKGVEAIEFDLTAWVETYGSGTATIVMKRWGDAIPYPIALEIDENNKATWTLSDIDTAKAGMAYAQLSYIVGDEVVKKSDIYTFRVMDSLTGEGEPPEAYESWLEHLTRLAAEAMAEVLDIEGVATDKTLSIEGGIADAKATGDALGALEDQFTEETDKLKADLGAFITTTEYDFTDGYYKKTNFNSAKVWTSKDEEPVEASGLSYAVVSVLEGDEIILTAANNNASSRTYILVDDSTNKVYASSNVREEGSVIPVTADGTLVVNNRTSFIANPSIVIRKNAVKKDAAELETRLTTALTALDTRLSTAETDIALIDPTSITSLVEATDKGYGLIHGNWTLGGWYSDVVAPIRYPYRVALADLFHTDVDLEVVCAKGYQMIVKSIFEDNSYVGAGEYACRFKIPANTNSEITVRRIVEDTTEVLTEDDVVTFSEAFHVVGIPGSDYTRLKPTFFGIEMFATMTVIGDSYSSGNNVQSWGTCMERLTGVDVTVLAQSGINSIGWLSTYLPTLLSNPATELYWLNLGINDGARVQNDQTYLGTIADVDPETYPDYDSYPETFYGCTGRIIKNIQAHAPNAKIVIQKTLFGNMRNAQADIQTTWTKTINDAIAVIAEYYGIPCLDQLDDPFYTSTEYGQSMSSNHPRRYAWVGMANANRRLLSKAILSNPEYFY